MPKEQSSLNSLIAQVRNQLSPQFGDNVSPAVYDYQFFTQLESFAKKEREKALNKCKDICTDPLAAGIVLETPRYQLDLSIATVNNFDKEAFIDAICQHYPQVLRHKLREFATTAVTPSERKSYKVIEKE